MLDRFSPSVYNPVKETRSASQRCALGRVIKPEDGTGSRHPLFGDAGSVTPPGFRRSLQKCSGLLFCTVQETPAGAVRARIEPRQGKLPTSNKKRPQTCAVAVWGLCTVYEWVTILPMMARWCVFVVSRRCTPPGNILLRSTKCSQLKCCARRVLHVQRVWDAAQQVLAAQGAVYIQGHCLQEQRIVYTHLWERKSKMFAVSFSEKSEKASQHAAMLHIWQRFFVHKWSNVAGRCIGFRHLWRRSFPTSRETCTAACTPSPLMERLPRKTVENCVLKF